jgi:nicotinamide mononucleotide adenylyltransferase
MTTFSIVSGKFDPLHEGHMELGIEIKHNGSRKQNLSSWVLWEW